MSVKNWKVRLNGVAETARKKEAEFKAYIEALTAEVEAAKKEQEEASTKLDNKDIVEDAVIIEETKLSESPSNLNIEEVK